MPQFFFRYQRIWVCLLAAATFGFVLGVFSPGLHGDFFFDDHASILQNPALAQFDGTLFSLLESSGQGVASPLGRPISLASFALNLHYLGAEPFYFKLVNLLIHLCNGIQVFFLLRSLASHVLPAHRLTLASWWGSVLWILHPLNFSPVLFVVQRMTSLSTFFVLLALHLYLYGRNRQSHKVWFAIVPAFLLCWLSAVFSKETGVLLPVFIFVLEVFGLVKGKKIPSRYLIVAALIMTITALSLCIWKWDLLMAGYSFREFGLLERLLTQARVLWFHVFQFFSPLPDWFALHHDDFALSHGLFDPPQTIAAISAWACLFLIGVYCRRKYPVILFAICWFFAGHLLESTILPLELAYEHRNYLPSFGLIFALVVILFRPVPEHNAMKIQIILALCFLVACTLVTHLRATQWGDEMRRTLWEVAAHPDSARANYEAALVMSRRTIDSGQKVTPEIYQYLQNYLRRAAELDRSGKSPLIGQLYVDCALAKPRNEQALASLRQRLSDKKFALGDRGMIQNLSPLLVENKLCLKDNEVDDLLKAALSNQNADPSIRSMLHSVAMDYALMVKKSIPLALSHAESAVQLDPANPTWRINLIGMLLASGNTAKAEEEFQVLNTIKLGSVDRRAKEGLHKQLLKQK